MNKNTIFLSLGGIVILIIGVILGIIIHSNVIITIDEKIRYSEILNWLTTIVIGVIIGYYLKNKYENNKIIKNYLLDDLKNISSKIINVKSYCYDLRSVVEFSEDQRKEIISRVNLLDKEITVFLDLLKDCNNSKFTSVNEILVNYLNSLNRKLTSDGLYENPIPKIYFDEIMAEGSKFESAVRKITLDIIKTM